jgi:hypothetical protein
MEPNHPIVDEPWRFCIIRIEYFIGQRPDESYIDLTLQEGISMQKLRFLRHASKLLIFVNVVGKI